MTLQNSSNTLLFNAATLSWNGTLTATSKNFVIDHPSPSLPPADEGKTWKLKHHSIESNEPILLYRVRINMESTTQSFQMPASWFPHLVKDAWINVTPYQHFGSAWGDVDEDGFTFTIHATTLGYWNVLITGVRNDPVGLQVGQEPIEYQESDPPLL